MSKENKPKTTTEEQKKTETTTELLCPKAGTATSSPVIKSLPPLINISKVEEWMKSNAYEPTTIKQTKKRPRYLMSNCNTNNPEEVKKFVSNKSCSNARKTRTQPLLKTASAIDESF